MFIFGTLNQGLTLLAPPLASSGSPGVISVLLKNSMWPPQSPKHTVKHHIPSGVRRSSRLRSEHFISLGFSIWSPLAPLCNQTGKSSFIFHPLFILKPSQNTYCNPETQFQNELFLSISPTLGGPPHRGATAAGGATTS